MATRKTDSKKIVKKSASKKTDSKKKAAVIEKLPPKPKGYISEKPLKVADKDIYKAIVEEKKREFYRLELIASENIVSRAILEAQGSILTNKYAEGYPNRRYYGGCEAVDKVEILAIERGKKLFKSNHINVQPHSGSQANMAVYNTILQAGDTYLGLSLPSGGHLTHGSKVNFSGKLYNAIGYDVDRDTMLIDYDNVRTLALEHKPKLIITGGSAYSRLIDFKKFRSIADEVGAYLMVDMAHFGGLVAAGLVPSPVPYAHFITGTTHKTLRGPRGGYIIATEEELAKKIDKAIFPGIQGGPLMHVIAAKAICFSEALTDGFVKYQMQVIKNAKTMSDTFIQLGYNVISGGTDTHLMSINVKENTGISGKEAEALLDLAHITVNKNSLPFDTEPPTITSGIRVGTPAVTSRGLKEKHMKTIVEYVDYMLKNAESEKAIKEIAKKVDALCEEYPIYTYLDY